MLFCSSGLRPVYGGPAFSEAMLCQYLRKVCDLTVLIRRDKYDAEFCKQFGLDVVVWEKSDAIRARFLSSHWLVKYFREAQVVHLNSHWRLPNWWLSRLARKYGVPYVFHPRGMLLLGHRRVWLKKLYNLLVGNRIVSQAARVVALSNFERRHFYPYPITEKQVVVIPNSVEGPRKIDKNLISEEHFILYIGRIESRKNLLFLLEAFRHYRDMGGKTNLLFVGPVERGYDEEIRARIHKLDLESCTRILPPVYDEKKWAFLSKASVVVYPATEEAFGRVPFETIAAGSYPLVPRDSGGAEYLEEMLPDCSYQDTNPAELAEKLAELDKESPVREEALRRARTWIDEHLSPDAIADRFVETYEQIVFPDAMTSYNGRTERISSPTSN